MELTFLGRGNSMNRNEEHTSAYCRAHNTLLLINCGMRVFEKIVSLHLLEDIEKVKIILTSNESKNNSSLAHFITYLKETMHFMPKQIVLYSGEDTDVDIFLLTQGIVEKEDYLYREVHKKMDVFELNMAVEFFATAHKRGIRNYGLVLEDRTRKVVYLADSREIHPFIKDWLLEGELDRLYVSVEVRGEREGTYAFTYEELLSFFKDLPCKERIHMMDLNEAFDDLYQYQAKVEGFQIVNPARQKENRPAYR